MAGRGTAINEGSVSAGTRLARVESRRDARRPSSLAFIAVITRGPLLLDPIWTCSIMRIDDTSVLRRTGPRSPHGYGHIRSSPVFIGGTVHDHPITGRCDPGSVRRCAAPQLPRLNPNQDVAGAIERSVGAGRDDTGGVVFLDDAGAVVGCGKGGAGHDRDF